MHGHDQCAPGTRSNLLGRTPNALQLPNKHSKHQALESKSLDTDHMRIGTKHSQTCTGFEQMCIKFCYASTLTAGLCPPIEHPTWALRLQHRGPSHRSGERGRQAAINDMHEPDEWSCISSITTLIRHLPRPWEGPRSAHQRPWRPPSPLS